MRFVLDLENYTKHDLLTIHLRDRHFFAPFGMLAISAKLRSMQTKRPSLRITFTNVEAHPYLAHVAFLKMAGMDYGRDIGEAWGSQNYLPITCLDVAKLHEKPGDRFEEIQVLIERHAEKIALVIARNRDANSDMFDVLAYSIREVIRNVFEHSGTNAVYYCAQYWPNSNKVEFAIADFGIGIRKGLGTNPNFRFNTDKQAIEYSLLPSVSGKTHLPRQEESRWHNSGYGLYMTSRLARNGGNFVLASGTSAIHLSRRTKNNYVTSFPGTVLRFNLDVGSIGSVKARLEEFREEGHKIAQQIAGTGNRPPSAMSLLLRSDYSSR